MLISLQQGWLHTCQWRNCNQNYLLPIFFLTICRLYLVSYFSASFTITSEIWVIFFMTEFSTTQWFSKKTRKIIQFFKLGNSTKSFTAVWLIDIDIAKSIHCHQSSGKWKLRWQWDTIRYTSEKLRCKRQKTCNVGLLEGPPESSYIVDENLKCYKTLGNDQTDPLQN